MIVRQRHATKCRRYPSNIGMSMICHKRYRQIVSHATWWYLSCTGCSMAKVCWRLENLGSPATLFLISAFYFSFFFFF
jgi:hypothetical protein